MKFTEIIRLVISSNSGVSSKRLMGSLCIVSGILIPLIAMFIDPKGEIHDSVLVLMAQLLTAGCGLLGLTLGESVFYKWKNNNPPKNNKSKDVNTDN